MTGGAPDTRDLRSAIAGLIGFAAAEEQVLLMANSTGRQPQPGTALNWAAVPVVAHNTEFKAQQTTRLRAIADGQVPPEFVEIDHRSDEVYQGYAAQPADRVAADSHRVSGELIASLAVVSAEDLLDPSRNPWLKGRQLWLQVVVRGFWHPSGHLADYYLAHEQPDRAVALAAHGVATSAYLRAPEQARGMAAYNLACALAKAGRLDEAAASVAETVSFNPDLRGKIGTEPDLTALRNGRYLASALA
jgi:hypothetical protein